MGRKRDPKRDKAFELYKASSGKERLTDIASQLSVSEGTVRGWKAKDKWESLLADEEEHTERSNENGAPHNKKSPNEVEEPTAYPDELFLKAVQIVAEAKQASVSLLQRRMRIGYSRAARLIDEMERRKLVGTYKGDKPREVYATPLTVDALAKEIKVAPEIRNAPKKVSERSGNMERSKKVQCVPATVEEPEPEIPDEDGLTPKQRIFTYEYLRDFNATRSAIAAGYSKKTAYQIGFALLKKVEIQNIIRQHKESMIDEVGLNAQRVLMEYMKIAFADITDYVEFGQKEEDVLGLEGEPVFDSETGETKKYRYNYVSFKNSDEIDGTLVSEVKQGKDGVSVKLHDKTKALDVLTKYMDLLPDKHKRMVEDEKLKMQREKLELERAKVTGEGNTEDDLIDDWVEAVVGDEAEGLAGDETETSSIQETDS
ncbi:terminase small subunit [Paenibacillus polymyxa]|uniref:terminase small subunit n=1 Tax=Paenibacillus polymyxa TaxID=1406 RepID=UPI0008FBA54A|nr:terminase small subunit [Paenibacillus polymyxa]APB75616.1 DNA translocase FtsK [Paenibacillus polymyxa]POR25551.1 cell division protein FtsK [Paenibacillus polymyxa]